MTTTTDRPSTHATGTASSADAALLDRIQKLMRLASNNPSEHEAALASTRIQELLQEYNLSMAEVDAHRSAKDRADRDASADPTTAPRSKSAHTAAAMYSYQRSLMKALAANNFCMHLIDERFKADPRGRTQWRSDATAEDGSRGAYVKGRYVKTHVLIGRDVNVITTQLTYDYLVETMDRLLPYSGMEKRGRSALLWLEGCADRLVERLDEARRKAEEASRAKTPPTVFTVDPSGSAAASEGALVRLADVYSSEDDLNHDMHYGQPLGTRSRERAAARAKSAADAAETKRLIDLGTDPNDAWYIARGFEAPSKETPAVITPEKPETDAQRRKRQAREARANARFWDRQDRASDRINSRRHSPEYQSGHRTGSDIGLDSQIKDESKSSTPTSTPVNPGRRLK